MTKEEEFALANTDITVKKYNTDDIWIKTTTDSTGSSTWYVETGCTYSVYVGDKLFINHAV